MRTIKIQKECSPLELRNFVLGIEQQKHNSILKKGLYKIFHNEIVPLSIFCINHYPRNYKQLPKLGNKEYIAIVKDETEKIHPPQ